MKKILRSMLLAVYVIVCTALSPTSALAHPPKDVSTVWNNNSKILTVNAVHAVMDNTKHYVIGLVILDANGKTIVAKHYPNQTSDKGFSDNVSLPSENTGDKITIRLICNIMGVIETDVTLK